MRGLKEIREEIEKVEAAEKQARRKVLRCEGRLIELNEELHSAEGMKKDFEKALRLADRATRQEFVTRLNRVIEMASSSDIKCVRIDERDDDDNEDNICRLVICYYHGPESRINIEINSITATFMDFCRFVGNGEAPTGAYMYHGEKREKRK